MEQPLVLTGAVSLASNISSTATCACSVFWHLQALITQHGPASSTDRLHPFCMPTLQGSQLTHHSLSSCC